jgi:predicted nicotinamide N-methyase
MAHPWVLLTLPVLLTGCGVAETGAAAGAAAESAAQQAAQSRAAQQQIPNQIDAAYREAEEQRRAAEADGK